MLVGLPVTRSGSILDRQEANGYAFGFEGYGFFAAAKAERKDFPGRHRLAGIP